MRKLLITGYLMLLSVVACPQSVTDLVVQSQHGQLFVRWNNIPQCDSGFYYVYKNSIPISSSSIFETSEYIGRVPYNFGTDFRLTQAMGNTQYLVQDDQSPLLPSQNLFVITSTTDGAVNYFAVRCDYGSESANWTVVAGENTTITGATEIIQPVKAYLQKSNVQFPGAPAGERMDIYIHYGTNEGTGEYPPMTNEGCLPFHFGIVKGGSIGGNNSCFLKFHGGGGDFFNNAITTKIDTAWKISFDDWIPAFGIDPEGTNTRWLGYVESFDVYKTQLNAPPPVTGTVRGYTLARINWELDWIFGKWNTSSYTTLNDERIYLTGSSQGTAAVLLLSLTEPWKYAAASLQVPKYNLTAPDDDNPDCKFNDDGSQMKQTRLYFGDENLTNLETDIPVASDENVFYRIYDLTNANYMFGLRKNSSLPFMYSINGKNDETTCWQEKIGFYETIQSTHAGGIWQWDLRSHNGEINNAWPSLDLKTLRRFSTARSYPAFSFCSTDQNPGDNNVSSPPYYNGDEVGALHSALEWVDSSIIDTTFFWQIKLFLQRDTLLDASLLPSRLPEVASIGLTIRRAQQFKDFPEGTELCWMNFYRGKLIQSGKVKQQFELTSPSPITIEGVSVFPDGNLFRVMRCDMIQPE